MSDQVDETVSDEKVAETDSEVATDAAGEAVTATEAADESVAGVPEFTEAPERIVRTQDIQSNRLKSVSVPVWAELGRVEMEIGDLLEMGEGTVVALDRAVGDPVDLVSQGVRLARGEVVVVNDCFAVRIREILSEN